MAACGTTRPCSGACHEISHAIDALFPAKSGPHGFQVGVGATYASFLRGDEVLARQLATCLRRNGLPVLPVDLGLTNDEFVQAVLHAPNTRPGRYTILEHLALEEADVRKQVDAYVAALA